MSSQADVAYSMLRREAENIVLRLTGVDVRSHPLGKMAFEGALKRYDPQIRGFLGMLTSDPPSPWTRGWACSKTKPTPNWKLFRKIQSKLQEQKNKEL